MKSALTLITPYEEDPALHREVRSFLKDVNTSGGKPMETLNPDEARKVLEDVQNSVKTNITEIEIAEKIIYQDELSVKVVIMRPSSESGPLPALLFFHGGGWMLGDFRTHERFISDIVIESGVAAIVVEYTRSPEAKYPQAINECYAALKWVAEHGAEINIDSNRIAVGGNSAGGNIATVMTIMAKEKKGPHITMQLLFWPVTNDNFDTRSYHQYGIDRFLTRNMMIWFWDNYIDTERRNEIYACPLKASVNKLKDLPPALIQVAENDVLRDEAIAYAHKLDEAGVEVTIVQYNGMIHDYGLLNPLAKIPAIKSSISYATGELKKAFNASSKKHYYETILKE